MKPVQLVQGMILGWGLLLGACTQQDGMRSLSSTSPIPSTIDTPVPEPTLRYESRTLEQSVVHILWVPASFAVVPAIADGVQSLEEFAAAYGAIAVLNGGFFDPVNQQTTSYIRVQGEVVADPETNERLVTNPEMVPYLDQILNRSELRRYQCSGSTRYDIALHRDPVPAGCQLLDSLGAGPQLLPALALVPEGFAAMQNGVMVRDALGSQRPNARTALGITPEGDLIWVMAAQLSESPTMSGLSLQAMADFLQTLGAEEAMNLDGGSSSSLYYDGKTIYGRVDAEGNPVQRPVKSVLLILSNPGD